LRDSDRLRPCITGKLRYDLASMETGRLTALASIGIAIITG